MRKWFFPMTVIIVLIFVAQANAVFINPDINNDGTVNWRDVLRVVRAVAFEKDDPDSDFNKDGVINTSDIILIIVYAVAYLPPDGELFPDEALEEFYFLKENEMLMGDINDNGIVALGDWEDFVRADLNVDIAVDALDLLNMGQRMPGTEPNKTKITPAIQRMDHTHDGWLSISDLKMAGRLMKLLGGDHSYRGILPDNVKLPSPITAAPPLSPQAEREMLNKILQPESLSDTEKEEVLLWLEDMQQATQPQLHGKLTSTWGGIKH